MSFVPEDERQEAIAQSRQASKLAALACLTSFGTTLPRGHDKGHGADLVIHGDSDATVPFEGSGQRTHETISGSELVLVAGGPHGGQHLARG